MDFESETLMVVPILEAGARTGKSTDDPRCSDGIGKDGDPMYTLQGGHQHAIAYRTNAAGQVDEQGERPAAITTSIDPCSQFIAFTAKDHGADAAEDIAPTLRSGEYDTPHANGGVMPAVAFHENQRAEVTTSETVGSLKVGGGKPGRGYPALSQGMAVRRLTPRDCERLQNFEDDWTLVEYRGKPAADGPRYKALGNAVTVSVAQWIFQRIVKQGGH
jgi:DNA (cytosine-5)-methyltransferase 1